MADESSEMDQIMQTMTAAVPKMLRATLRTLYDPETAREMGQAVAAFHAELVGSMQAPEALELTRDYMRALRSVFSNAGPQITKTKTRSAPEGD